MTEFPDFFLKFAWANHHLEQLQTKFIDWYGDHQLVLAKPDPDNPGYFIAKLRRERPPVNPFGLIIGDVLQNFRACLDHLALALARAHTDPLPEEMEEDSEFPIMAYRTKSGKLASSIWNRIASKKLAGVHPDAQTIIESLQPYQRGKNFESHPLWALHELSRIDKHRVLHPMLGFFFGFAPDLDRTSNVASIDSYQLRAGVVDENTDTIVTILSAQPIDPSREMQVYIKVPLEIAFEKAPPTGDETPVVSLLIEIYDYINDEVIPPLDAFLP